MEWAFGNNSDGSGKVRLTDHTVDGYGQNGPIYSRSGNLIAYVNYATSSASPNIWVMNSDGSGKQQITFDTAGQYPMFWWSDDSLIGYVQNGDLWLRNFSAGTDEMLLLDGSIGWADLSPDASKLVLDLLDSTGRHIWIGDVTLASEPLYVETDIKPGSCPNPLNVMSNGLLSVAILGSPDLDVTTIDIASLRLEGVAPLRSSSEDVATPVLDRQDDCDCTEEGPDGYLDFTVKFNIQDIVAVLGEINDGDELKLTLTGALAEVFGATPIEGSDCVVIIAKSSK